MRCQSRIVWRIVERGHLHYSSTTTRVNVGRGVDLGVGCVVLP
ncbi:hypothetical protein [Nocardia terpenica]|nr:hypothetical protein [Nocardia terpenica]